METPEPPGPEAGVPGILPGSRSLTPDEYAHAQAMIGAAMATNNTGGKQNEREIEFAEFETRIRKYNLELLQPSIRKTATLEYEFGELKAELQRNSTTLAGLTKVAGKVEQQVELVESFREDLGRWDNERRQFQAESVEQTTALRQDLDSFRYQLERQDSSIHSVQRTMDRVVGELGRVQDGLDSLRGHVETRLGQHSKMLNGTKTDIEVKLTALEARHNRLSDDLWGDETGLAKVVSDLAQTNNMVTQLNEEIASMRTNKANVTMLQAVQEDVNNLMTEANNNIATMKQNTDTMIDDVKAHFRTATNTVAAHNAAMLQEVRGSYQEELSQSARLRNEIITFMQEAQQSIAKLEDQVGASQEQTDRMVKSVWGDVEEVGKLRKRDRSNAEVEQKSMQEQLAQVMGTSEDVAKSLEHLSSCIWMLVQSDRAASALEQQDDSDRGRVALMGYREAKDKGPGSGRPPSGANKQLRDRLSSPSPVPSQGGSEDKAGGPVISVDHRCLSCSGQAQSVLSGFKMACLQYTPGPVAFAKKVYNRTDLLDLREKLLEQAHESLLQGPVSFNRVDPLEWKEGPGPGPVPPKEGGPSHHAREGLHTREGGFTNAPTSAGLSTNVGDLPERPSSRSSSGSGPAGVRMPPLAAKRAVQAASG